MNRINAPVASGTDWRTTRLLLFVLGVPKPLGLVSVLVSLASFVYIVKWLVQRRLLTKISTNIRIRSYFVYRVRDQVDLEKFTVLRAYMENIRTIEELKFQLN